MSYLMKSYVCLGLDWKEVVRCGLELMFCCGCLCVFGAGRESRRFGTSFFGSLQLTARAGHLSDVKFIQVYRKLVSA